MLRHAVVRLVILSEICKLGSIRLSVPGRMLLLLVHTECGVFFLFLFCIKGFVSEIPLARVDESKSIWILPLSYYLYIVTGRRCHFRGVRLSSL